MTTSYTVAAQKTYALLTAGERKRLVILLALMLIGMTLETLGVGLVIPAVTVLLESDPAASFPLLIDVFGNVTQAQIIIAGMLTLVGVYLLKAVFLGYLAWYQHRFAFGIQEHVSRELYATYLHRPYTFHLQRNSAQMIQNAVNEVHQLWFLILNPTLVVFSEGLVLLGIMSLLFVVEPVGALVVVFVLGGAAYVFYRYMRVRLLRLGHERQRHEGLRIQHLQQGLGGVKEVKLLGREANFVAQYGVHNIGSARVERFQATLQLLPRLWVEFLAVAGLAALVLATLRQGRDPAAIIPTLGLFAAAAFRLMPSAYRTLSAVQNLPYGLPIITTLHEELTSFALQRALDDATTSQRQSSEFRSEIQLAHVDFTYPAASDAALSGLSIAIHKGESVGFVGPSGSGKSTLVDIVLGMLAPTAGKVTVDGEDIQEDMRAWQSQIGYVPQSVYFTDDTLRNNVAFGIPDDEVDEEVVQRAIEAAQLATFVTSLPDGLETRVGEHGVRLSGGQRQRIGIARALYNDPSLLVLDEATSALDTLTEQGVMKAVIGLQKSKTLLIVSHRLSTVEHCSRLYRLDRGRVTASGTPAELIQEQKVV